MIAAAKLSPHSTALLFLGAEGYLSRRTPVGAQPALLETVTLLRHARRAGAHVIHVRRVRDGESHQELQRYTVDGDHRRRAVVATGEAVIDTRAPSPFADAPVDAMLAALGVDAVVVAGLLSAISCAATVNGALAHGYRTIVASAGFADDSREVERRMGAEVLCSTSIGLLLDGADAPVARAGRNGGGRNGRGRNGGEPSQDLPRRFERSMPPTIDSEVMP